MEGLLLSTARSDSYDRASRKPKAQLGGGEERRGREGREEKRKGPGRGKRKEGRGEGEREGERKRRREGN